MKNGRRTINVLLDHRAPLVESGLMTLLGTCQDMQVNTTSIDGVQQDVIIANYTNGLAHLERLRLAGEAGNTRVLILTHRYREWDVRTAISAGAHGYLLNDCGTGEVVEAIRSIYAGAIHIHQTLLCSVAQSYKRIDLTSREHEVLSLLAQVCCNKSIARELGIGIGTVKTHVKGVFGKLGATARTHAVVLANQRGLVN